MNERFKELWSSVCKEEMPELDETCMTLQRQKKFAELIVKECCDTGSYWAARLIDTDHYDYLNQKIKEHFGVEV